MLNEKEIAERQKYSDPRVFFAIEQAKKDDKSFTEKGFFGFSRKYTQDEVRDIYFDAMAVGIETGLNMGSLEGQRIDLFTNANERQKEYLRKIYELSEEYNCAIQFHPREGMCVVDLKNNHKIFNNE